MTNKILYYENVQVEEKLPSFELTINRTHIVKYAGASGDFFPVHHDEEFAKSIGLPSVFAMGLMHGGMLAKIVTDWAGDGRVKRYKLRFATMVWPGDTLGFSGQVVKKYQKDGENFVECTLAIVNQKGESAISGEATVSLPLRS